MKCFTLSGIVAAVMLVIVSGCTSSPTGQESNNSRPDTLNFGPIAGAWEGGGRYEDPENDPYDSDSLFVTHLEITRDKTVGPDSIGYMKWNNTEEYCYGPLHSKHATESENRYEVALQPRASTTCRGGNSIDLTLSHIGEGLIEWQGGSVQSGTLHRK